MSGIQQQLLGGPFGVAAYQIQRSLRFNSADSAYLSRTPGSASNQKTFTFSAWVKRNKLGGGEVIFSAASSSPNNQTNFLFNTSDQLAFNNYPTASDVISSAVYRDVSAWMHVMLVMDTTQATASNRTKLYVNGSQITSLSTADYLAQNTDTYINSTKVHNIGAVGAFNTSLCDLMMADVYFIDGQALTPSSFGETNADTGVWQPKAYTGTYGTNGFYLNFSDNSGTTSTTLGKDTSGNGNNWTPNNFSVTAGTGNDSLVDTPTPYGSDTGAGGEVRGNYCTLNPLDQAGTLANGNLYISTTAAAWTQARGTFGISSGKWYWETTCNGGTNWMTGIAKSTGGATYVGANADGWGYSGANSGSGTGEKYTNGSGSNYGATYTTNDVIGVAFDADAGTITFYKNGSSQGQAFSGLTSGPYFPAVCVYASSGTSSWFVNFGQRAFAYTAPSGFKALVTQNLSTPTVIQGDDYFNTVLYTGTGSSLSVTGVGFQPDFVWIKSRSAVVGHILVNSISGATKFLQSNLSNTEVTDSNVVSSFGSDGFTVGSDAATGGSGSTYVAWNWKAGGSGVSNTDGSITSTVSANPTAGISIVTYSGTGSQGTVGHGLGAAPAVIFPKSRSGGAANWESYHISLGANKYIKLNSNDYARSASTVWGNTTPTSSVFTVDTSDGTNYSGYTYVAYCFAPVAGFSAFGSYTGNGSSDGPFCYAGFQPKYLLIKCSSTTGNWIVWDTVRNTYNVLGNELYPNLSNAEASATDLDITSNGFKIRNTTAAFNSNGATYIYAAFAAYPFKYSLAR